MPAKRIIVTMSTGNQGSATVRALAKRNETSPGTYEILAVTRNANSSKAQKLASLSGVKILESEYNSEQIFKKATEGGEEIYGVFSVQPWTGLPEHVPKGTEGETVLGKEVVDYSVKYKVQHFVYASVDNGSLSKTDVPHFESKRKIEEYIVQTYPELSYTFLKPVAFMDNFTMGTTFESKVFNTYLTQLIKKPIQLIAASDIGEFAALAFDDPSTWKNKKLPLAGDYLSSKQILETVQEVKNKQLPLTFTFIPKTFTYLNKEMGTMMNFFNTSGFSGDLDQLRKLNPQLKTFKQYVETEM